MKKGIKNFILKLPGIRGFFNKWKKIKNDIDKLQKQNKAQQRTINDLKQQLSDEKETVNKLGVMADMTNLRFLQLERVLSSQSQIKGTPLVSIIMLNRNGKRNLEVLMNSFHNRKFYDHFEIICVDNASTDDSVEYLESWKEEFTIKIIRNEVNMSFSAASNLGADNALGEYLLFLNNDTEVTDGWLDELLLAMQQAEHPGAIGGKLIYPQIPAGTINEGKSYSIQHKGIAFKDSFRAKSYFIKPYNMGKGETDADFGEEQLAECIGVTAAVLLVKKSVFEEIGGYDEQYIYGYEDIDFCLKLSKAGYRNYYCPTCLVYHYEFGTQNKDEAKEIKIRRLHNMDVFKGKWQSYLSEKLLEDKLLKKRIYTEEKLVVGLVITEADMKATDGNSYTAIKFSNALVKSGYEVKYLSQGGEKDWYDVGIDVDVLISMLDGYDISAIYNIKSDLIKIAWAVERVERWCEREYFAQFDLFFACSGADSQYIEAHSNQKAVLFPAVTDENINAKENVQRLSLLSGREQDFDEKCAETFREILLDFNKDSVDQNRIDILGAMPDDDSKKFWGDQHFAEAMKKQFERNGYRVCIRSKNHWYDRSNAKYIVVLRGTKPYYPSVKEERKYIMWNISHPEDVTIEEYNMYDYVFFASVRMHKDLQGKIAPKSSVLLQCVDEEVMTCSDSIEKQYELLFVGNSRHVFRQILKDLLPTEHKLSVYGRHWDEFPVKDYVVGEYIENNKVGQAYHDAQILLNDHWDDMREYGIISNRIFDALAVGAFVISDDIPEIQSLFEGNVVTYSTREDLKEKIDYYLKHPEERQQKAKRGQEIVLKAHTFAHRIKNMQEIIRKL